jgi:hypothetical protein
MMLLVLTLVCVYFAAWEATKEYGISPPGGPAVNAFELVSMADSKEYSPMPFVLCRIGSYPSQTVEYDVWLPGRRFRLLETELVGVR